MTGRSIGMLTVALSMVVALASAPRAWSHEGHEHGGNTVMGTVTAVHKDMNHVEVKAKDGHTMGFKVDASTKYMRGATAATLDDIKVGDHVVATVAGEGDTKTATTVKLGAAAAAKSGEKAPAATDEHSEHKH